MDLKPNRCLTVIMVEWTPNGGVLFYYVKPFIENKAIKILFSFTKKDKPTEYVPRNKPSIESLRRERRQRRMSLERAPTLEELKKSKF